MALDEVRKNCMILFMLHRIEMYCSRQDSRYATPPIGCALQSSMTSRFIEQHIQLYEPLLLDSHHNVFPSPLAAGESPSNSITNNMPSHICLSSPPSPGSRYRRELSTSQRSPIAETHSQCIKDRRNPCGLHGCFRCAIARNGY